MARGTPVELAMPSGPLPLLPRLFEQIKLCKGGAVRSLGMAALLALVAIAPAQERVLREYFPAQPFFGKVARDAAWSHDGRYLAYLWNPYPDRGMDLWVHDTRTDRRTRLTSPTLLQAHTPWLGETLARYAKLDEETKRRESLAREERWRLEDQDRLNPPPGGRDYSGIGSFAWGNRTHRILFAFEGDLFQVGMDGKIERITETPEAESGPRFGPKDESFRFVRGGALLRMRFDSPRSERLSPELTESFAMESHRISEDERSVAVIGAKEIGTSRRVPIMTYRERWAKVREVSRAAADDPFSRAYRIALTRDRGAPWEVFRFDGGAHLLNASVAENPWSPDGTQFAFGTWARDGRKIEIKIADLTSRRIETVLSFAHVGDHATPLWSYPQFTPDGRSLLMLLERDGSRRVWRMDLRTRALTPLTAEGSESFLMSVAGGGAFLRSTAHDPARFAWFRYDLSTGALRKLSQREGHYEGAAVSRDGKRLAGTFQSWASPVELSLWEDGRERALTDSHSGRFDIPARPRMFSYKNRHGDAIYGYGFFPASAAGAKRPLVVYVYGGPGRQVTDGTFGSSGFMFNAYLAEQYGMVTVTVDTRGTTFRGGTFADAHFERPGVASTEDLEDLVKHLVETESVDPARTAVYGWSFGGFAVQHAMLNSKAFTLGIAGAGPTEWMNYNNWYSGSVVALKGWERFDLTKQAANLSSPLMLIHGMEDDNVLFQDTVKVYREYLRAGKGPLVELVLDPTGGHGLGGDLWGYRTFDIYESFLLRRWGLR